jgi:hypothetical protein
MTCPETQEQIYSHSFLVVSLNREHGTAFKNQAGVLMKLPFKVLQGLAVAMAGFVVAGCDLESNSPQGQQPTKMTPSHQKTNPTGQPSTTSATTPGKIGLPDGCPACGRG